MGILADAQREAKRVASRKATRTGVTNTKSTEKTLSRFPIELRRKVLNKAVRAAGGVVRKSARGKLARNRSVVTGTREGWSDKTKAKRSGNKDLYQSIFVKVRDYDSGKVVAMTGARWPFGAHAHLIEFGGFRRVLWGKAVQIQPVRPTPFLRPAADETRSAQEKALIDKVDKEWKKV